jgi:gluconokinase
VGAAARQVVVGLDVGTTSAKAVAFAPDGSGRGDAAAGYPLEAPASGVAEQDPARMVEAALDVLRDAAAAARADGAEIAGVAVSTAMHGIVGVDADGRS